MLEQEILNRMATAYEEVVEKRFKKLRYSVQRLDRQKPRSRPDLLISNSSGGAEMLCEVKTVFSGGYLREKGVHVSMLDEELSNFGVFETKIDRTKIDDCLTNAAHKRAALVEDEKSLKDVPLLVAFAFDFFADFLLAYPRTFNKHVSGILTIEKDVARVKAFEKLSLEEQERCLRTGRVAGLPPNSKNFVLVRNKNKTARRPVPRDFQLRCNNEGYDESM
jgi:hypothetical protein